MLRASLLALVALVALVALAGCDGCERSSPTTPEASVTPPASASVVMNATPVPTASVTKFLNPENLPPYQGPTGSVEGTITLKGPRAAETPVKYLKCTAAAGAALYGHAFREGEPETPNGPRWLADAVVVITGYSGFFVPEKDEAEALTIEGCGFSRRTIAMTFGQRLEVKNLTPDFWTPVLQPAPNTMIMMATPGGDAVKIYPKRAGRHRLVDHDRPYAAADLYAFLHPLHAVSATGGKYRIDGVPVGKLKVGALHPGVPGDEVSHDVTVSADAVAKVDFVLVHVPPPTKDAGADSGAYYPPLH